MVGCEAVCASLQYYHQSGLPGHNHNGATLTWCERSGRCRPHWLAGCLDRWFYCILQPSLTMSCLMRPHISSWAQ
ncbi:hypothetical protein Pmani_012861 [Petrolisthes manimaculis]|uniref:Uncharacterized protein n=1 Tax=Petrolisthes manimaculis TaxID=1843537 RepID=A0AAE1PZN0_9EUCA|nr:hypothetical protein Pmani_012861 [Petrolisthes manimaculis]